MQRWASDSMEGRASDSMEGHIFGFYRASYALAVYAMVLCLCVCLSVTSRCSAKMAKHRNTQTTPHDSPGTLVF